MIIGKGSRIEEVGIHHTFEAVEVGAVDIRYVAAGRGQKERDMGSMADAEVVEFRMKDIRKAEEMLHEQVDEEHASTAEAEPGTGKAVDAGTQKTGSLTEVGQSTGGLEQVVRRTSMAVQVD
jgi:chemotaxis response regulator CheB